MLTGYARLIAFRLLARAVRVLRPWLDVTEHARTKPLFDRAYDALRPRGVAVARTDVGRLQVDADRRGMAAKLLLFGQYEPDEVTVFRRLLRPGMSVLDGGANIGYYTVLAMRLVGVEGHVVAVEPERRNFSLLLANQQATGSGNGSAVRAALGRTHETGTLFSDDRSNTRSSLSASNVRRCGGAEPVEVETLDNLVVRAGLDRVDAVKLDLQGAEPLAVAGGERTLGQQARSVILEVWPWGSDNMSCDIREALERLSTWGYQLNTIEKGGRLLPTTPDGAVARARQLRAGRGHVVVCGIR